MHCAKKEKEIGRVLDLFVLWSAAKGSRAHQKSFPQKTVNNKLRAKVCRKCSQVFNVNKKNLFLRMRSKAEQLRAHLAVRKSLRASPSEPFYLFISLLLTELRAVVKCSTVMVTTTVCSRTASSSRTPSFGPEPVITTDPSSGTRPSVVPSRSQTSRTRTMAERERERELTP